MLVILDMQEGLYSLSRDFDPTLFRDSMIAHSALGQVFDIPVVMTTSSQIGPLIGIKPSTSVQYSIAGS